MMQAARARKYSVNVLAKAAKVGRDAVIAFRAAKPVRPSVFSKIQSALLRLEMTEPPLPGTPEAERLKPKPYFPKRPCVELLIRDGLIDLDDSPDPTGEAIL